MTSLQTYRVGGFIIFNRAMDKVVIVSTKEAGNLGFPKGHKTRKESIEQCAIRETEEESGIELSRLQVVPLSNVLQESLGKGKKCRYFVAITDEETPLICDYEELSDTCWMCIKSALEHPKLKLKRKYLLQEAMQYYQAMADKLVPGTEWLRACNVDGGTKRHAMSP